MSAHASVSDLPAMYAGERVAIDAALERACDTIVAEAPPALADAIRYALEAKGKRLRPILCVAAYRATKSGAEHEAIYDVAAAIELIHTYSLVHDDLPCMDDDDLRRGRPTTHRVFGTAPAAVAGAALIPHACACLEVAGRALGLDDSERATLVRELARAAGGGGMVGGQLLDLEAEGSTLDIGKLQDIHRRKTGALFEASLRIGGVAARASTEAVDALGECGRMLGLAFQITDDLLDETGQSAVLGKTAGRDREREKATFPRLLGVTVAQERAEDAAAQAIDALERAGIDDTALRALVRFAVERDR